MSPMLKGGPLALDEHGSYWILDADVPGTMLSRSLDYAAIPPLSSWMQSLSLLVFGKSELSFRLPSALCYLATIPLVYWIGRDIRGPTTGGIAALIIAWHPEAMDEVRIARCYGLVLLLGACVVLTTLSWSRAPRGAFWPLLWMMSASALLWTHYTSALLPIAATGWIGWICWRCSEPWSALVRWLIAISGVVVASIPLVPSVLRLREWGPALNYMPAGTSVFETVNLFWWLGIPVGCLVSWLFRTRSRHESDWWASGPVLLLGVCSLGPVLLLAMLSAGELSSLANPRYRVAYAPAGACLAAVLLHISGGWRGMVYGVIPLLLGGWLTAPGWPWQLGRLGDLADAQWHEVNLHLRDAAAPHEPLFVQSGLMESHLVPYFADDPQFMEYVACRVSRFYVETPHPRRGLPFLWNRNGIEQFYAALLDSWHDADASFWIASATDTDLNRASVAGLQRIARQAGFSPMESREWSKAQLVRYARISPARE